MINSVDQFDGQSPKLSSDVIRWLKSIVNKFLSNEAIKSVFMSLWTLSSLRHTVRN